MSAALGPGNGVDLVDDDGTHARKQRAPTLRREEDVEGFGRRDEDVRRDAQHAGAGRGRRVAAPNRHADFGKGLVRGREAPRQFGQRPLQVAVHVVGERLERRHVHHLHRIGERRTLALGDQGVQLPQERGERLAGPRRRQNQRVLPLGDGGPPSILRRARLAQGLAKPPGDKGVEETQAGAGHT